MADISMEATDIFHATAIQSEPLRPGDKFKTDKATADQLEERGLAKRSKARK